jgi:hypothetical protein
MGRRRRRLDHAAGRPRLLHRLIRSAGKPYPEEGRVIRPSSSSLAGAALAVIYVSVVAATLVATDRPVRPLFDGLVPPPPYRWVNPPPGAGFNTRPERDVISVPLTAAGSELAGPAAVNGQVVLNLPEGAIPPRPGATEVRITVTPLDPGRLGPLPEGLTSDGNAYEIGMRYRPSGGALADLAVPGNIILATPEPASVLLFSSDGRGWETIDTQRVGGPDSVGGPFLRPGHYVAAVPGIARPVEEPGGWLRTARRAAIVVLSVALVANLARRALQRRRARRGM